MKYLLLLALYAFGITGWVMNIMSLADLGWSSGLTVEAVIRIIGIPMIPVGVFAGYF